MARRKPGPYTTSVDAALALARERGGGEFYVSLHDIGGAYWHAEIAARPPYVAEAATPALALCAAILRALKDQQP